MHLEQDIIKMSPEGLGELLNVSTKTITINRMVEEPTIAKIVRIVNGADVRSVVVARVVIISDDRAVTFLPDPKGIRISGAIFCGKLYHDGSCPLNGNVKAGEIFSKPGSKCCSPHFPEEGGDKRYSILWGG